MIKNKDEILMPIELNGLKFRNPFFVSSGPASKTIKQLIKAKECGWAGASIKLTFDPAPYINLNPRYRWYKKQEIFSLSAETRLNMEEGLKLIEKSRSRIKDFILIANIAYSGNKGLQGWVDMAKKFESAGAHVIELNMCCPNMSFNVGLSSKRKEENKHLSGATVGKDEKAVSSIVKGVKKSVSVPVFVKLTPEGGRIAHVANASFKAGADVVVSAANRLGISSININNPTRSVYHLQREPSLDCLSGSWIKPLALRDVYEIRNMVGKEPIIMGTGGIIFFQDVVEMFMCGADLIGICTAILIHGFDILKNIYKKLREYLNQMGFKSFNDIRDILVKNITPTSDLTINDGTAVVNLDKCTGCGICLKPGHCNSIRLVDGKAYIDKNSCLGCGICSYLCPSQAIGMVSR